jgi:hypothetical protein
MQDECVLKKQGEQEDIDVVYKKADEVDIDLHQLLLKNKRKNQIYCSVGEVQ